MTIRLMLVGGSSIVAEGIRLILGDIDDITVVGEAHSCEEDLTRLVDQTNPDMLLVHCDSVGAPDALTDHVHDSNDPHKRGVVMMAASGHAGDIGQVVRAGVNGYVTETDQPEDLVKAIRSVAADQAWLSPSIARELLEHYRSNTVERADPAPESIVLSPRERMVIKQIAQGQSNAEAASELMVASSTIKTHVSRILRKLELRDRTQLARFAHENGLA